MATSAQLTRIANAYQQSHNMSNQTMADALGVTLARYKRLTVPTTKWMWSEAINLATLTGIGVNDLAALK